MKKKIVIKLSGKVFGMDNAKIIQKYADFLIKISKSLPHQLETL